jgi:prevent-host-death family protein
MIQNEVGIRELKARLSAYLRHVKAGGTVTITERGRPIGRIVPLAQSTEAQLEALSQVGLVAWSGERLPPLVPVARTTGDRTVADLLLEDRE